MNRNRAAALVTLAVAAIVTLACGSTSTKEASPGNGGGDKPAVSDKITTVKVGATIALTDTLLGSDTAVDITLAPAGKTLTYKKDGSGFGTPDNGAYLVLKVTCVVKKGKYSANPFNFKFVGKDGTVYESTFADFKPVLNASDLAAGQRTAGGTSNTMFLRRP